MRALLLLLCVLLSSSTFADPLPPMLAQRAPADIDPTPYWVSEKLDGVRAHWDGQALRLRNGAAIAAPAWFVAPLPGYPLDGELWLGRGRFDELSGIVRRERSTDADWRAVRYMLFDLPDADGDFSQRLTRMQQLVEVIGVDWIRAVPQQRLADRAALQALFDAVVAGGGEGLMLHRVDAHWTSGRSDALLKLTPFLDAEATVLAHLPGKGRHRGRLGALEVVDAAGRHFRIGSGFTDAQRAAPPAIGAVVTYRYRELTPRGQPRFPVFLRERLLP
ncbi:DNA ligase [Methyloversatilis discipulorum]|uniref:DNA ligase n=1 Tax=Methyloversatilis discipulorum TaxID=1119528 RepID=UPI00036C9143|nr:DNA ligase [Methyloversatilis discipulorum]